MRMRTFAIALFATGLAGPASAGDLVLTLTTSAGKPVADAVVMVRAAGAPRSGPRVAGPLTVSQKDTQFHPFVLIAPVGAEVSFPNLDPFHHHVYSFSKAKTFELKLYGKDQARKVAFDTPGVVGLGCNIHDQMSAFIRVVDTPYAVKTGANGQVTLRDIPAGPATVTVWHPYLKAPGQELSTQVTMPARGPVPVALSGEFRNPRLRRGGY
jgi:plastocyanin